LLGILNNKGFQIIPNIDDADIAIIHTCSFIEKARKESERCIREVLRIKKIKNIKVFVSGCLPQLLSDEILKKFPNIDGYVGTGSLNKLPDLISNNSCKVGASYLQAGGLNNSKFRMLSSNIPSAYLKIAEGCGHKCSFCIIPDLRGKYESIAVKNLVDQAKALAQIGIKELIIIAQDTTSYGIDLYNRFALDKLLKSLSKIDGLKWIRLLYAYPQSINDELLNVINDYEKICGYIDIPVQHISKKILSSMRRPLNTRKIIEKITKNFPNIVLRTSFIAGFPNENDKDVNELIDFVRQGHFRYAGVFEYSDNDKAPSSKLSGQIDTKTIKDRKIMIEKAQYEVFKSQIEEIKNKEFEVLIEDCRKAGNGYKVFARTEFQSPEIDGRTVFTSKTQKNIGSFQKVILSGNSGYTIKAKEIPNEFTK